LVGKHLGKPPVKLVACSHSYGDHWGGVRDGVDEADVQAGYEYGPYEMRGE